MPERLQKGSSKFVLQLWMAPHRQGSHARKMMCFMIHAPLFTHVYPHAYNLAHPEKMKFPKFQVQNRYQ